MRWSEPGENKKRKKNEKIDDFSIDYCPFSFGLCFICLGRSCFGTYLVGTFDMRSGYTVFQIVNPTARPLELLVAFLDDSEKPIGCIREKLSHNDLIEIDLRKVKLQAKLGVAKIVSHIERIPCPGIIGFQRNYFKSEITESNLASIHDCFLYDELKIIKEICK